MKRSCIIKGITLLLAAVFTFTSQISTVEAGTFFPAYSNSYNQLSVPTQVTKIGDTYYLVDSYHNQILYSKRAEMTAGDWTVMAGELNKPHAIAGDGVVLLVADTENHRVVTYQKQEEGVQQLQTFENIGVRPHYTVYDEETGLFYVWSSMSGQMYMFRRQVNTTNMVLEKVIGIPELYGKYTRSFTIEGKKIYFPCVDLSSIIVVDKDSFAVKERYQVPQHIAGMVQLTHIQNSYYLTVSTDIHYDQSTATIVRAASLSDFSKGNYQDLNKQFGGDGAPYYISYFDDTYYTMVLRQKSKACGYAFTVKNDEMCDLREIKY